MADAQGGGHRMMRPLARGGAGLFLAIVLFRMAGRVVRYLGWVVSRLDGSPTINDRGEARNFSLRRQRLVLVSASMHAFASLFYFYFTFPKPLVEEGKSRTQ